ncbi:MAG: 4-oxalocrotonate tautomerase [Firmicutes bacterium]|nr:4-oxalocrotonate tautomerase [Bacillota bacterium]
MPIIQFDGGSMSKEDKVKLAAKLTEAANSVLPNIPKEAFTVVIKENNPDNIAVGGTLLSDRK